MTRRRSIHGMVLQSIKSNMGHVWMDCPHREKLGWMEVCCRAGIIRAAYGLARRRPAEPNDCVAIMQHFSPVLH